MACNPSVSQDIVLGRQVLTQDELLQSTNSFHRRLRDQHNAIVVHPFWSRFLLHPIRMAHGLVVDI